jgi:peptide methionine sulfoxide reductase MsrB
MACASFAPKMIRRYTYVCGWPSFLREMLEGRMKKVKIG